MFNFQGGGSDPSGGGGNDQGNLTIEEQLQTSLEKVQLLQVAQKDMSREMRHVKKQNEELLRMMQQLYFSSFATQDG
jgi:hypothetical protein